MSMTSQLLYKNHVSKGHEPPNLFITLLCAEYYWKDVARLLKQRFDFSGIKNPLGEPDKHGRINTVKNVNDFSNPDARGFVRR